MNREHWSDKFKRLASCPKALVWARTQESYDTAWQSCERGDWMLRLLSRLSNSEDSRKKLVMAACECARSALVYIPELETRPRRCIETTESWTRGEATLEQVEVAAEAARAARPTETDDPTSADWAAEAARTAGGAAFATAWAAEASAWAAAEAVRASEALPPTDAARAATLKKCADIVRRHYPEPPDYKGR